MDAIKELEKLVEIAAESTSYSGEEYRRLAMALAVVQALRELTAIIAGMEYEH